MNVDKLKAKLAWLSAETAIPEGILQSHTPTLVIAALEVAIRERDEARAILKTALERPSL
jgi:hypothetical protein